MAALEDKIRRHRRRKRAALIALIAAVCLFAAAAAAWFAVRLTDISVVGNQNVSESQIERMVFPDAESRLTIKARWFTDYSRDLPMLQNWSVAFSGRHSAVITVEEKPEVGKIAYADSWLYFDEEGYVIGSENGSGSVPELSGFTFRQPVMYSRLMPDDHAEEFTDALTILQLLNKYGIAPVSVHYDSSQRQAFSMELDTISVVIGTPDYLEEKIRALHDMQDQLTGLKGTLHLETYDGSGTENFYFVRE